MHDWSTRITDLEAAGWSLKALGEEVGLSTSSISDIKRGATVEPRGMAAVRLHELHLRLLAAADADVPQTGPRPEVVGQVGDAPGPQRPTAALETVVKASAAVANTNQLTGEAA